MRSTLRSDFAIGALLLGMSAAAAIARPSPQADEQAIRSVLEEQEADWNRGDIPAFMSGYWKSDETEFVGSGGVFRGWQNVLRRYERTYPDRAAMGQLTFSGLEIRVLCPDSAYVLGQYRLDREQDQRQGVFTLVFRKFPEGWRIVHDHTSQSEPAGKSK